MNDNNNNAVPGKSPLGDLGVLLQKYNHPVPRYTSYPPANHFTDSFGEADYLRAIEESNQWNPRNISFYIHIPFCNKMCLYCGCNMVPMRVDSPIRAYVDAVKTEIEQVSRMLDPDRKVSQIHYGGGTPNAIPVEMLRELNELIFSKFQLIDRPEIAIECNPAHLTPAYIEGMKAARFNRFSLGIQDFDASVLRIVNRDPSAMPVDEIFSMLKNGSPDVAVNLDFIYGLPKQTADSFAQTIEKAISYQPDRLVTFSYAHVPWVNKAQHTLEKAGLPVQSEKMKMFKVAYNLLTNNGYRMVGFDHYAQENDELSQALDNKSLHRNFQGYCTRRTTGQVYAFGVSGISQLEHAYSQSDKNVDSYIASINQGKLPVVKGYSLSRNEMLIREVINELMCNKQVNWDQLAVHAHSTADELKQATQFDVQLFREMESEGIVHIDGENLTVPDEALLFSRNVASLLDPLIKTTTKSYSKPV